MLFASCFVTFASIAAAEPDASAKQQARDFMTSGREARAAGDLQGALASFTKADAIMQVPTTGLERAKALVALGRLTEASDVLAAVVALPAAPDEPEAFLAARAGARELAQQLDGRLGHLRVSLPDGAQLTLDGDVVSAQSAVDLRVDPGHHLLTADIQAIRQERAIEVSEGATVDVAFEPVVVSRPAPAPSSLKGTRTSTIAIYSLSGLALAGAGSALGLALWSEGNRANFKSSCAPQCSRESVDRLRTGYIAANIAAGVGAAAAIAAFTVYIARPKEKANAALSGSAIAIGPSSINFTGTF